MKFEPVLAIMVTLLWSGEGSAARCTMPKAPDAEVARRIAQDAFISRLHYSKVEVAFLDVQRDEKSGWIVSLAATPNEDSDSITVTYGGASMHIDRCSGKVGSIRVWR